MSAFLLSGSAVGAKVSRKRVNVSVLRLFFSIFLQRAKSAKKKMGNQGDWYSLTH